MMRKHSLFLLFFLFNGLFLLAQDDALTAFNQQRIDKQQTGMLILGGWAVGNIALGSALVGRAEGVDKHFHTMNIAWNAVNLGIAAFGYYSAAKIDPAGLSLFESVQQQNNLQKILLLNAGLDVGYMLGGAYLIERSKNAEKNAERLEGFGKSIVLQGAFLFVFDLAMNFIIAADNPKMEQFLSKVHLYGDGQGIGLLVQF